MNNIRQLDNWSLTRFFWVCHGPCWPSTFLGKPNCFSCGFLRPVYKAAHVITQEKIPWTSPPQSGIEHEPRAEDSEIHSFSHWAIMASLSWRLLLAHSYLICDHEVAGKAHADHSHTGQNPNKPRRVLVKLKVHRLRVHDRLNKLTFRRLETLNGTEDIIGLFAGFQSVAIKKISHNHVNIQLQLKNAMSLGGSTVGLRLSSQYSLIA